MKKIIALLAVLVIIFSFAGCSAKDDEETTSDTVLSTAENENPQESTSADSSDTNENNQNNSSDKTTIPGTTEAKTSEKNTEAAKNEPATKRKIKLNVKTPYYNSYKTNIKIEYKLSKDKKYKVLAENEQIVLDKAKSQSYDIDENLTGDVDIRITLDGVELLENDFVVKANEREITISLVTGQEMLEGGFD